MPIDNENPITPASGVLYMKDPATGEDVCLGQCGPITGTIEADPADEIVIGRINKPQEATLTINIPPIRKITRKRFLKLLMSYRVPRNVANSMAEIVRKSGHTYAWGFVVIKFTGFLPWED